MHQAANSASHEEGNMTRVWGGGERVMSAEYKQVVIKTTV